MLRKKAFTLIELLVVISIIGILIGLLLPAVQKVRESANRIKCSNNFKQIILGMTNYQTIHSVFPPGSWAQYPNFRNWLGYGWVNHWNMYLLPYVELENLFNQLKWDPGFRGPNFINLNDTFFRTKIELYQCPSDTKGVVAKEGLPLSPDGWSRANYVVCNSPDGFLMEKNLTSFEIGCNNSRNPSVKRAFFNWNVTRSYRDITDGSSNTIGLSEVISGPDQTPDSRGVWWSDLGSSYTHLLTPNSTKPDILHGNYCYPSKSPCIAGAPCWSGLTVGARSYHSGGVNGAMLDGSVRFFLNSVNPLVWTSIASIDGGEFIEN